ncbi:MAG: thioredoxin domain-containing protein [Micropruina sp.]|uniref:thioredoxin domain-containing protein n=1 Tax=Micropruina sp. TaxID=2737536 RepID=UPI0039E553D7
MANRLVNATSPYLRQHANNPIDWWPWTPEAFDEARRRDVPILLSVGYAACHWCHVMAHESFEDAEVAALVNAHFVAIKVDREERPDVDAVHMKATQALTGQGGWPMTVFLTPDGRPFFAGTYYPPEPAGGMPSFTQVVTALADAWASRRDEVLTSADAIVDHLAGEFGTLPEPESLDIPTVLQKVSDGFDPVHGGFGRAPKFPAPGLIDALLVTGEPASLDIAQRSLEAMLRGGIHDQVGGGFHRYSVDAGWVVPHFEKMLYDNALLLGSYTRAWCCTADHDRGLRQLFERTARGIVRFLADDLQLDGGGFASSLDADSCDIRGMVHEGIFYVWSPELLTDALGEADADWACEVFHVTQRGTFEHGLSTLQLRGTPDWARLDAVLDRLREVRSGRFAPARDDKLVAAWNGFAIDSLVNAALVFGEPDWLDLAERAGEASWRQLIDGDLRRTSLDGEPGDAAGMAEDYGALALGYARLAGALGESVWLDRAVTLLEAALARFAAEDGGFYDAPAGVDGVQPFARARDTSDNPTPSGTTCLVAALRLVGLLADRWDLIERAEAAAGTLRGVVESAPRFAGWAFADVLIADQAAKRLTPAVAVVVTPESAGSDELVRAAARMAPAGTALVAGPAGTSGFAHHFDDRTARDGASTAYVCRGMVCFAPASTVKELRTALWQRA